MAESKMATTENHNPSSDPRADERLAKLRSEQPADAPSSSTQGRPTPTQEEVDRIVRGENVVLEPDGSPEQHQHGAVSAKHLQRSGDEIREERARVATEPPPEPIPTQAQVDAIARGDHLRGPTKPALPEGAAVPEGMHYNPPEKKAGEPDGDKAAYKTRDAHPDSKRGSKKGEEDKK